MTNTQDNSVLQANTSKSDFTIDNLAPNNYLSIMWKGSDSKTWVRTLKVDLEKYEAGLNLLNNAVNNTKTSGLYKIINNKYMNLGSVAKYFAQSSFDSYGARQAVTGLINILEDGKIQEDNILNAFLYYSGDILRDVAKDFGVNDINPLIQQLAGQNILNNFNTFDFLDSFCRGTQDWTDKAESELNEKGVFLPYSEDEIINQYSGILLGITESDTHSIDIDIPRKRTESGYNYTSHVIVNPFKKDLKLRLTNKVINGASYGGVISSLRTGFDPIFEVKSIEAIRDTIESIAESKTRFDIYLRLSDEKYRCYTNLMFSSLSFDKTSSTGLSYDFSCTIEPVYEYIAKTYIFTPSKSSTNIKTNKSTSSNNNRTANGKSNTPKPQIKDPMAKDSDLSIKAKFKTLVGTYPENVGCNLRVQQEYVIKDLQDKASKDKRFRKYLYTTDTDMRMSTFPLHWHYFSEISKSVYNAKLKYGAVKSAKK